MKIDIPEKYTDLYIKALEEKKEGLLNKIEQFKREIADINVHINNLTSMSLFGEKQHEDSLNWKTSAYQEQWSWTRKITYYQEFTGRIVTTSELVDFILDKEHGLEKNKVRSSVSAALSNWVKKGNYRKFEDPITGRTYYGPAHVFMNQHEPKIENMPQDLKERLLYNK